VAVANALIGGSGCSPCTSIGDLAFKASTGSIRGYPDRSTGFGIARLCKPSCGPWRIEFDFQLDNLVTQAQAALLESPQQQIITQRMLGTAVDQAVEIGVLHAKLDQLALRRMQVELAVWFGLHEDPEFIVSIPG